MHTAARARLALICAMLTFGTIGLFRRLLPIPSGMLAMFRGIGGMIFLLLLLLLRRDRPKWGEVRASLPYLLISGGAIGINWILLFEAYAHTTVAAATLSYYMAPIFVLLASPFVLRERLTLRKTVCVLIALIGMVPASGILRGGEESTDGLRGALLALGAACFYAGVILLNGKIRGISAFHRTIFQLGTAGLVILPYSLFCEDWGAVSFNPTVLGILALVCILHTGIAYALYFYALQHLPAQTAALYGYIDPISALLLSSLFLREPMGWPEIIGAVLILAATLFSDFPAPKPSSREEK